MKGALQSAMALCCYCAQAGAVMVDPDGKGEVLLFPYYSVNDGQQTLLTLVNHTNTGKAVKVRFRESSNGRTALSLNVYLSEFDVWTAAVIAAPQDNAAALITFDNTCTLPAIRPNAELPQLPGGIRYLTFNTADFSGERSDGGSTDAARTREGYVEVIEMGTLENNSDSDFAATHVGGVPRDCEALVAAWGSGGYWSAYPLEDLLPPSGQLSGTASIVSLDQGTVFNADPTAISGFSIVVQHTGPNDALPDLASAVTDPARLQVESTVLTDGRVYRSYWPQERAIDAMSAVLMMDHLNAEFNVDPVIAARSDWVITMPTRRHYVDPAAPAGAAVDPFAASLHSATAKGCERLAVLKIDRSGRRTTDEGITFGLGPFPCLCQATQQLSIRTAAWTPPDDRFCMADPLSAQTREGVLFTAGFFDMSMTAGHRSRPAIGGERYLGLPVIGFMRTSYQSRDSQTGQLRVYSSSTPHNGTVQCDRAVGSCSD